MRESREVMEKYQVRGELAFSFKEEVTGQVVSGYESLNDLCAYE
jgi:hypothetical protein